MQDDAITITAMSGVTPVGGSIEQSCTSIAAGIALFEEYEDYLCLPHDPEWDPPLPLTASPFSLMPPGLDGYKRLVFMGVQALKELIPKTGFKRKELERCAVLLALPLKDEVTASWQLQERFVNELLRTTGISNLAVTGESSRGGAGVLSLINRAQSMIQKGEVEYCVVGGIDSFIDADRLALYDEKWRIKSDRNVDGFIPGEGAVMFLLEKASTALTRNRKPSVKLSKVVGNVEPNNIESGRNSSGVGLGNTVKQMFEIAELEKKYAWTFSDMNGESYRGHEWGTTLVRNNALFDENHKLEHPADCVGELGAALSALLVAQATFAFSNDMNVSDNALILASSDTGERAAMLIGKS